MRQSFEHRAGLIHGLLSEIPGVKCPKPTGAFYVFPDISAFFGKKDASGKVLDTAAALAESLLEEKGVAVVPGEDFEGPEHIRLSFATDEESIRQGCARIKDYLLSLS
jgi:aspartate aminotransferase